MNKAKAKCAKAKAKCASKVAKGKAKVAKKCTKACVLVLVLSLIVGCQNPAQRAQTADTRIQIFGGSVTFGNEFVSLAQANETGGNDAGQVATPTNDIKPDVDVTVGGKAAAKTKSGALKDAASAVVDAVVGDDCPNGNCEYNPQ